MLFLPRGPGWSQLIPKLYCYSGWDKSEAREEGECDEKIRFDNEIWTALRYIYDYIKYDDNGCHSCDENPTIVFKRNFFTLTRTIQNLMGRRQDLSSARSWISQFLHDKLDILC